MLSRYTRGENRPTYTTLVSNGKSVNYRSSIMSIFPREDLMPTQGRMRVGSKIAGFPVSKANITREAIGWNIGNSVLSGICLLQIMKK